MDMVLRQLRFFGLLDIVKIRRLGYPEQRSPSVFWRSYWSLIPEGPADHKWHAFETLLPARVLDAGGLRAAYRAALPPSADWAAWDAKREPILKRIESLEAARTAAAKYNERAEGERLAAEIRDAKNGLRDEHGEFAPPEVHEAARLLCAMLLAPDEFAVGTSGLLYTKLGVTQRLDEMLALAMGLEVAEQRSRAQQLATFASPFARVRRVRGDRMKRARTNPNPS